MNENVEELNVQDENANESNEVVQNVELDKNKLPNQSIKKKSNKKVIIIIIILIALIGIGVGLFFVFGNKPKKETVKNDVKKVYSEYEMKGNDLQDFDLTFLKIESGEKNIIYSPLSIKYALEMLSEGAKGTSKNQIDALLGSYKATKYTNSSNMSFANAMFIKNTFKDEVKESYTENLKNKYNAEVIYDEFTSSNNINKWVSDKTFGLIDNLVDDVSSEEYIIINALAIDMNWNKLIQTTIENYKDKYSVSYKHENYSAYIQEINNEDYGTVKFNNKTINSKAVEIGASINNYDIVSTLGEDNIRQTITKEYTDWLNKGGCGESGESNVEEAVNKYIEELNSNYKQVKASTDFKFYDDDTVKVFSKELKEYNGTTLEYVGIMPKQQTLTEYVKASTAKSISQTIDKTKEVVLDNFEKGKVTKIVGGIPLFKYNYQLQLIDDLKSLGVTDIFDANKANLTGITKDAKTYIGSAAHKADIEFSNEGIKAAAATSMGGYGSAGCAFEHLYEVPVVTVDLTFDNPYLYVIRDKNTKEVWFVGTVYEPIVNTNANARIINE